MQRNMEQVYEAEIKLLQEEILMIQNQLENNEREVALHFTELTQNEVQFNADLRGRKKDIIMNLKLELENMEADLARQTKMNGIELTTCEMKTLEKSQTKTVQQHRLSGHCYYLAFQVEFEVTEVQEESSVSRIVTDLSIVVDGCEFSDISTFVSGAEERKSLLLFFRTLKGFSQRCEHRNRTFLHFKEKYPEVVSLPEGSRGEVLVIRNSRLPGCTLNVVWRINVTVDGVITPKIDLLAKMPEQALGLDQKNVVENAPQSFQSLLRILGVEASIEAMIVAVSID